MSVQTPSTLQNLTLKALLRDEALALSCLEAIVAAWTFPCLPVGALMKSPNLETLQAVLDGIDMQLTRESHPRCVIIKLSFRDHLGTQ